MKISILKILSHGFILSVVSAIEVLFSLMITNQSFYILSYDVKAAFLSFVLVLGLNILIYSFSNIIISVFINFNFISLLSIVSLIKYEKRNLPLVFNDLSLFDEITKFNDVINISDYMSLIITVIVIEIIIFISIYFIKKKIDFKSNVGIRIFGLLLSIMFILTSFHFMSANEINFEKSGPIYTFFSSINNSSDYELTNEESALLETLLDNPLNIDTSESKSNQNPPNIIIIMNEAFWDMDLLPNVTLEPNPYDYFNKLKEESTYGRFEVPVFGGGTSNTEFEILSSISTHMYSEGVMIFNHEIQRPVITLASILRNQGYYSVGLHPFWGWYYNRNTVYNYLGFDEFVTEEFIDDSKVKGYYISDETSTNVIIDKIEKIEKPLFLYAVTIQNHGPYDDGRYDSINLDLRVTAQTDDLLDQQLLETYGQGIYDAIDSLKTLITYLESSDEETIVVFFGDHLPMMGDDFKVYRDTGFLDENDDYISKHIQMRTTPFILWSNRTKESKDIGVIDAINLGPYLLDQENLSMPNYYKYLLNLSKKVPFINPVFLAMDGEYYFSDSSIYTDISSKMIAIEKDILYGDQVYESNSCDWDIKDNSTYNSNIKDMTISNAFIQGDFLIIEGSNLYKKSILYLNNDKVAFIKEDDTIKVNIELLPNSDYFTIKLKLIDTIEKTLAQSNEYTYEKQLN
ncbi:MAG: sulfatase-like hydrolase/transferase [Clostridiales bacterium]|nr:sulfatase-like hydrolase/transferase [Clostridiales bacterium]